MSTPAVVLEPDFPPGRVHRLSVAQYQHMARAGILGPDDRVELLEGWLVEKMTKNPPHRIATRRVRVALEGVAPDGWYVDSQEPIATADSEPEPDAAIIRGVTEDYADRNPEAEHVALVVEIAGTSLLYDRETKARIYARAGIPVYWLLNLTDRTLEVHTDPSGPTAHPAYGSRAVHDAGETVAVVVAGVDAGRIAVVALLP